MFCDLCMKTRTCKFLDHYIHLIGLKHPQSGHTGWFLPSKVRHTSCHGEFKSSAHCCSAAALLLKLTGWWDTVQTWRQEWVCLPVVKRGENPRDIYRSSVHTQTHWVSTNKSHYRHTHWDAFHTSCCHSNHEQTALDETPNFTGMEKFITTTNREAEGVKMKVVYTQKSDSPLFSLSTFFLR